MINLNITFIVLVVNFLIVMLILSRKLFKPMLEHLDQRDEAIHGSLKNAKEFEEKSEKKLSEYKTKLQGEKKNIIIEQSGLREEALERQKEIIKNTRRGAEAKVSEVTTDINKQIEAANKEFPKLAPALASDIVSAIIGKSGTK